MANLNLSIEKFILMAYFLTASAVAQEHHSSLDDFQKQIDSPALRQFQVQADCATRKALTSFASEDLLQQSTLLTVAKACVPTPFTPEMHGLPPGLEPATREQRIDAIAIATSRRIKICERIGILASNRIHECIKMFGKEHRQTEETNQ